MTLIIAMANSENAIIASDRRLVGINGLLDDESNKAGFLVCRDARLGFAFSGLAECAAFKTNFWLPETLARSAEPDGLMVPIIERFRRFANKKFAGLKGPSPCQKRLSVIFAGYHYGSEVPRPCVWRVSNYERGEGESGFELSEAQNEFEAFCWADARSPGDPYTIVRACGFPSGIPDRSLADLISLVKARRPAVGLVGKSVAMIREAAAAPASKGAVGMQCSTIVIPSDPNKGAEAHYHSEHPTPDSYVPAYVLALGGIGGTLASAGLKLKQKVKSSKTPVLQIPKAGRNQRCPCGSGRKYKKCHGR